MNDTSNTIRAACVQLNSGTDIGANLKAAEVLIRQAASSGAQLIVTPENTDRIMKNQQEKLATCPRAEDHPGIAFFAALAKDLGVWLLIGSMGIKISDDKVANRSHLFAPDGRLVSTYDKIHMFDVVLSDTEFYRESEVNQAGERSVVVETPLATLGLSICYDLRFAHLFRNMAKAGAQILCIPAAFTVPTGKAHWHTLMRARAIETGCFVMAPAQVGEHDGGRLTYGHSLVVAPWGEILGEMDGEETGFITVEIDLAAVDKARKAVPALQHDREFRIEKIKA